MQEFAEAGHELLQHYSNGRKVAPNPPAWGWYVGGVMYPGYLRKELMILCCNVAIGAGRVGVPLGFDIKVTLDADEKTLWIEHLLNGQLLRGVPAIFEALTGSREL